MRLVLPFSRADKHRLARLLGWLLLAGFNRETYGRSVSVVLAHARDCDASGVDGLSRLAFSQIEEFCPRDSHDLGWPEACNFLFIRTAQHLEKDREPFLWLEADAVPLAPDFFERICRAYRDLPAGSFMGQVSYCPAPGLPLNRAAILHSGVAVYPEAAAVLPFLQIAGFPWDCQMAPHIAGRMRHSDLIQDVKVCPRFRTFGDLQAFISPRACVFHHSKNSDLIDLLSRNFMGCPERVADPLDRENALSVAELQARAVRPLCNGLAGASRAPAGQP